MSFVMAEVVVDIVVKKSFLLQILVYIEFLHSRINKSKIYIHLLFLKSFQLLIVIVFLYDLNNNHCKIRMHATSIVFFYKKR